MDFRRTTSEASNLGVQISDIFLSRDELRAHLEVVVEFVSFSASWEANKNKLSKKKKNERNYSHP